MRLHTFLIAALASLAVALPAFADTAPPAGVPFPSATVTDVFVAGAAVDGTGSLISAVKPGDTVAFRANAIDLKTHKVVTSKDVKYFYVEIPGQKSVKFQYTPTSAAATKTQPFTATWTIPTNYVPGIVNFRILIKTVAGHKGQFVQMPVVSAMLTVNTTAPPAVGTGPKSPVVTTGDQYAAIYLDTVNGRPTLAKRPGLCSATNVFKRGEQIVFRSWGVNMADNTVLSNDNVESAVITVPGAATIAPLHLGTHGNPGAKVFFFSTNWVVPADYPLGEVVAHVTYTLTSGKVATYDYPISITP